MIANASVESRLPTGFREVQWLQGSGTQYCVTDIYPVYNANNYTAIRGDFTALDAQNSKFEIGSLWLASGSSWRYGCAFSYAQAVSQGNYQSTLFFFFGKYNQGNATVNYSNYTYPLDVHFEINANNLVHNGGTSTKPIGISEYSATRPLVIGGMQGTDGTVNISNTQTRYKEFKIYNNNTLLYEFVPCYRKSDNKTGFMKITVADGSTEFFPNMGTDEWIIGTVV